MNKNEAFIKLLSSIFYSDKTNNDYKIIKNTSKIPELLSMLNSPFVPIEIKVSILTIFKNAFCKIRHYMEILVRYDIALDDNKQVNLYLILLNQYSLYKDIEETDNKHEANGIIEAYTKLILSVLELLIANVTCPIEVFEYIYDLFKPYLSKETNENKKILDTKHFFAYFNLLSIVYGKLERTVASQYFYFSGQGEMIVSFDDSSLLSGANNEKTLITFEEPFALFTWFRIGITKEDMKSTFSKSECHLIRILQSNQTKTDITLDLNNSLRSSTNPDLALDLNELKWYMLAIAFNPIDSTTIEVKIHVNSQLISHKQIPMSKKSSISSISLFKNFIGESSTIFIVKGKKYANLFGIFQNRRFKFGINSEKALVILNKTLQNDAYFNYPLDYVQNIVRINQKKDFPSIKDFVLLYMPNRYEEESDTVIRIKHPNINARIEMSSLNFNGVHVHKSHSKNITMIKGLYHLLPLVEMISISHSPLNPYPLLKNILTQEVINEFCMLIGVIKGNLSKNKSAKELINFIRFLALFLEKIPSKVFNSTMFEYLKTLVLLKDCICQEKKKTVGFINEMTINVFLNKEIYFKFDTELQEKIWSLIETYSITNKWCSVTMNQLCEILIEYDKEKHNKYCCIEHARSFNATHDRDSNIEVSNTKAKIKPMANVISFIIKNNPEDIKLFYGLLTIETSPCLQTFIINVTSSLFNRKTTETSKRILDCLKENQIFINISLFVLSFAVFEVRYELMVLIFVIMQKEPSIKLSNQQTLLIQNDITPVYMIIRNNNEIETQKSTKSVFKEIEEKDKVLIEDNKEIVNEDIKENNEEMILSNIENGDKDQMHNEVNISHEDNNYPNVIISDFNMRLSKEQKEGLKQFYFPQSLNQDSGMIDVKGYNRITLKDNEEFLSKYYNETDFKETLNKLFVFLFFKFTEQTLQSLIVSCLIKISPLLDIACNTTFINILNNKESSYIQSLSNNGQFHHWLIETIFQGCIARDPLLKGALKVAPKQIISDIDPLIKNGLSVHTILCMNNIYLLDYFLQWSTYYKKLYENDGQYNQCLFNFISSILSELFSAISNDINELDDPNKSIRTKQFLYSFSIFFEFLTVFHIGKYFDLYKKASNDKIVIDVPHYYSSLFKNTLDDSKKDLNDKWENYILFKTIVAKCYLIWHDKINYPQIDKYGFESKHLGQNDYCIVQLKLLTYGEESNTPLTNRGIPLIVILSNLMTTMINEIQTEEDLDYWLQVYCQFLIFIIVSSISMPDSDDHYALIQDYSKDTIAFGICFLVNQYYKKKITIALSGKILIVIRRIFTLMHRITKKISDDISKEKTPKRPRITFSKANVVKNKADSAAFKLSCAMAMNGLSVFKVFDPQMPDSELKQLLDDSMFKQAMPENSKFKEIVDSIFVFNDLWLKRKNNIKNIIPVYSTFCSYSTSNAPAAVRLDTNYIEKEYYEAKSTNQHVVSFIKSNIEEKLELYQRKRAFNSKQREKKYKQLKKALFTFRGFWSQKELFYNRKQELKYKVLNHLTNDYTKPLLIPLVDYDYYLPPFTKFEKKNLFFDKKKDHSLVELDTMKYLIWDKEEASKTQRVIDDKVINPRVNDMENNSIEIKEEDNQAQNNKLNALPLNRLKKEDDDDNASDNVISKINKSRFDKKEKQPITKDNDLFCLFVYQQLEFSFFNPELKQNETDKPIPCCYIKLAYHVKGYIVNDSRGLMFYAYDWDVSPNSDFYDYERDNCYGSLYKTQIEQKKNLFKSIPYKKIEKIFLRKAVFIQSSLEIFTINKKSYLFQFWSQEKRDIILTNIKAHIKKEPIKTKAKEVGYENCSHLLSISIDESNSNPSSSLLEKYSQWTKWEVSTLEFIMYINIFANRSYNDLSQYPVFPWIITDYSSQVMDQPLRDFGKPMGMLDIVGDSTVRKKNYIIHYESMLEDKKQKENEDEPYVFGTHFSNAMYSCYYLMRLFPFANIKVELQGNSFDNPNRLFNSLYTSFYCVITQKSDLRELIPEFFCLPEMFRNINDFDFGEIEIEKTSEMKRIQSVILPPWCNNNPYQFIELHRRILEGKETSKVISAWFDIIFGSKQKTVKEIYNLYREETYDDFEEKYKRLSSLDKGYMCRMLEFGITPLQILNKDTKPRNNFNETQQEDPELNDMAKYPIVMKYNPGFIKERSFFILQSLNKKKKLLLITDVTVYSMELKVKIKEKEKEKGKEDKEKSMEKEKKEYIYEPQALYSLKEDQLLTPMVAKSKNNLIVTYNKGKCLIRGGYWNGQISAQYTNNNDKQCYYYIQEDMSPIVLLTIDQEEKFIFCGTQCGLIHIYFIPQKECANQLVLHKTINKHNDTITAMHCNSQLNVLASASSDGFIMLYTMPKCKLFNLIKVPKTSYIGYLFVSSSPLPCFVYYDHTLFKWNSYSINGEHLNSIEIHQNVANAKFFTDKMFMDHIVRR